VDESEPVGGLTHRRPTLVLVLDHGAPGGLGSYHRVLSDDRVKVRVVRPASGAALPDWRSVDGIVALGGSMSVLDRARLPWLGAEERLISEAVRAGKPYWGVCLGAQLLASSLDAPVYRGHRPEVGVELIEACVATRRDPVFSAVPDDFFALEWHQDTYELPAGAVLLAHSSRYRNQAFRWGPRAYGIQFHLELSSGHVRKWKGLASFHLRQRSPAPVPGSTQLLSMLRLHAHAMANLSHTLLRRWLQLL
jgi:GMP synthase-like glutamine amidotransferase